MNDKDLYVVIAEMLRKQDQQSEILELHTIELKRIAEILQSFISIATRQFEQQQIFNENFLYTQNKMSMLLERVVDRMEVLENRFDKLESRFDGLENRFDGLENRFDGLENRFDHFEKRFDDFSIQTNANFNLIADRLSGIESKLN